MQHRYTFKDWDAIPEDMRAAAILLLPSNVRPFVECGGDLEKLERLARDYVVGFDPLFADAVILDVTFSPHRNAWEILFLHWSLRRVGTYVLGESRTRGSSARGDDLPQPDHVLEEGT